MIIIFSILMIWFWWKMLMGAVHLTWGLTKILFRVVLLPLALIGLVFGGLIYLALPLLIIFALIALISPRV